MTDLANTISEFESLLPTHKCELSITHNEHKCNYETVQDWIDHNPNTDWKDEDQKLRAISTNELWVLQWYPETPVGFNWIAAPTLLELIEFSKA